MANRATYFREYQRKRRQALKAPSQPPSAGCVDNPVMTVDSPYTTAAVQGLLGAIRRIVAEELDKRLGEPAGRRETPPTADKPPTACRQCGGAIPPNRARPGCKYCSDKCRKRAHRAARQAL